MSARSSVPLLRGGTREPVKAVLIQGVDDRKMRLADMAWQTFLQPIIESRAKFRRMPASAWDDFIDQAYESAARNGVSFDYLPEHSHWSWQRKQNVARVDDYSFGIECDGQMQALMLVRSDKHGRLPDAIGMPLVYVDYVATAPWNQIGLVQSPRYRNCGIILIAAAIQWSIAQGWEGRIGLHSLPSAEDFYGNPRKCGMVDLGIDRFYEGLHYFEMSAGQARTILERLGWNQSSL